MGKRDRVTIPTKDLKRLAAGFWIVTITCIVAIVLLLMRLPDDTSIHNECVGFWVGVGKDIDTADWLCEQEGR